MSLLDERSRKTRHSLRHAQVNWSHVRVARTGTSVGSLLRQEVQDDPRRPIYRRSAHRKHPFFGFTEGDAIEQRNLMGLQAEDLWDEHLGTGLECVERLLKGDDELDFEVGDNRIELLEKALANARRVVLVISPEAMADPWVEHERHSLVCRAISGPRADLRPPARAPPQGI